MSDNKKYLDIAAFEWKFVTEPKPNVMVKCRVIDGADQGQERVIWLSCHENAMQYTVEALRCFGWTGNDIETELDKEHGMGTLRAVGVEVNHEWPAGTWVRKVKYINPYKPRTAKTAKATGIGKRFKSLAKSVVVPTDPAAKFDLSETPEVVDEGEGNPFV